MQHAAQPEQTQQHQLVEKEVGYHRVAPFHGGKMEALYPFCRLLNYPHARGTRPNIWETLSVAFGRGGPVWTCPHASAGLACYSQARARAEQEAPPEAGRPPWC